MARSTDLGEQKEIQLGQGTIRYRERGSGEPIVFIHGLLVNGDLWRKVVPSLAAHYRCIVPDLPLGSHDIAMSADADLTPSGLASLVADFLAALELESVTLVANDTGGAISQIVVTEHPERIGRLVLTSCDAYENFLPLTFRYLQWLSHLPGSMFVAAQVLRFRTLRQLPFVFGGLTARPIDRPTTDSYLEPARTSSGARRDVTKVLKGISTKYTLQAAEKLKDFDRPTLIAWGADDRFFPVEHARKLAGTLSNSRLELIEDCRSFVPEDQPEVLARLIREFVSETALAEPQAYSVS